MTADVAVCRAPDCYRPVLNRGLCKVHMTSWFNFGWPTAPLPSRKGTPGQLSGVLAEAGITYRQLDHWCRTGAVVLARDAEGSGSRRQFTDREVAALAALGRLSRAVELVSGRAGTPTSLIGRIWPLLIDAGCAFVEVGPLRIDLTTEPVAVSW